MKNKVVLRFSWLSLVFLCFFNGFHWKKRSPKNLPKIFQKNFQKSSNNLPEIFQKFKTYFQWPLGGGHLGLATGRQLIHLPTHTLHGGRKNIGARDTRNFLYVLKIWGRFLGYILGDVRGISISGQYRGHIFIFQKNVFFKNLPKHFYVLITFSNLFPKVFQQVSTNFPNVS